MLGVLHTSGDDIVRVVYGAASRGLLWDCEISERQVRRLLVKMRRKGDGAVIHALRGRRSNRRCKEETRQKAMEVLKQEVYRGFGPTLASEYLANSPRLI